MNNFFSPHQIRQSTQITTTWRKDTFTTVSFVTDVKLYLSLSAIILVTIFRHAWPPTCVAKSKTIRIWGNVLANFTNSTTHFFRQNSLRSLFFEMCWRKTPISPRKKTPPDFKKRPYRWLNHGKRLVFFDYLGVFKTTKGPGAST